MKTITRILELLEGLKSCIFAAIYKKTQFSMKMYSCYRRFVPKNCFNAIASIY